MRIPLVLNDAGDRPVDVVGFGVNSLDLLAVVDAYPGRNAKAEIQTREELPGGQVATAMVACARLGWRTRYVGRVGSDRYGDVGIESLRAEGVDVSHVERVPGTPSHFSLVIVDRSTGERTVLWHRDPRLAFRPDAVPVDALQVGRILLVDALETQAATRAIEAAAQAGMATVVDVEAVSPHVDELLSRVDILIAADRFPSALTGIAETGAALSALAKRFPNAAVVCVTLGEEGSLARCSGREVRTPAFPIRCADSTGAGDAFRAGFIAAWLKHADQAELEEVLRYANATAALACRRLGARAGCPRQSEVAELLHSTEPA